MRYRDDNMARTMSKPNENQTEIEYRLTLTINKNLLNELKNYASGNRISVSQAVTSIIEDWFESKAG